MTEQFQGGNQDLIDAQHLEQFRRAVHYIIENQFDASNTATGVLQERLRMLQQRAELTDEEQPEIALIESALSIRPR